MATHRNVRLQDYKSTEFVWELNGVSNKVAESRAVRLRECLLWEL